MFQYNEETEVTEEYKVGFTASAFDLLHAGHIAMLEEAKTVCDYLIVALQNDPTIDRPEKNKPVQSIVERTMQLRAVRHVDEILVYNTEKELEDYLMMLPIDVRIIGEEYKGKIFTGAKICKDREIEIYYNKRMHGFSSSELRDRIVHQAIPAGCVVDPLSSRMCSEGTKSCVKNHGVLDV